MGSRLVKSLVFLLLLALTTYALFPFFMPALVNYYARQNGIGQLEIELGYPSARGIAIEILALEQPSAGRLRVQDSYLSYGFLAAGPYRIDIGVVDLAPASAVANSGRAAIGPLSDHLPAAWLSRLPDFQLSIEKIRGLPRLSDVDGTIIVSNAMGLALSTRTRLQTQIEQSPQHEITLVIAAFMGRDNTVVIDIYPPGAEQHGIHIAGDISHREGVIEVAGSLRAKLAESPLAEVFAIPDLDLLQGLLQDLLRGELNASLNVAIADQHFTSLAGLNDLQLTTSMQLTPVDKTGNYLAIALNMEAGVNGGQWTLQLSGPGDRPDESAALVMSSVDRDHRLALRITEPLILTGVLSRADKEQPAGPGLGSVKPMPPANDAVKGELLLLYQHGNSSLATVRLKPLALTPLPAMLDSPAAASLNYWLQTSVNVAAISELYPLAALQLDQAFLDVIASGHVSAESLLLKLDQGSQFSVASMTQGEIVLRELVIDFNPQQFKLDWEHPAIDQLTLAFAAKSLSSDGNELVDIQGDSTVSADSVQPSMQLAVTLEPVKLANNGAEKPITIPRLLAFADITLSPERMPEVNFSLANACREQLFSGFWRQRTDHQASLKLALNRIFSASSSLRHWLNYPLLPLDLTRGEISAELAWTINEGRWTSPRLGLQLSAGGGLSAAGSFDGVQLRLSSKAIELPQAGGIDGVLLEIDGELAAVDPGFTISNIQLKANVRNTGPGWRWQLRQFEASIFDGYITMTDQSGVLGEPAQLSMQLKNIDLEQLVATQQLRELQVTGRLNGELPLVVGGGKFSLSKGELSNFQGGMIHYQSDISDSDNINEQLKLTLDVLENFNYTSLVSQVNYVEGRLKLQSAISGNNPDVAGGQLVNLNLNTEIDINSMLMALRFQSGIDAELDNYFNPGESATQPLLFCQSLQ